MDGADGCILEVVENERLVFTSAMGPGYRPVSSDLPFTAVVTMEASGSGTLYRAVAVHGSADTAAHGHAVQRVLASSTSWSRHWPQPSRKPIFSCWAAVSAEPCTATAR